MTEDNPMAGGLFADLTERIARLPLWAQVLLAARIAARASEAAPLGRFCGQLEEGCLGRLEHGWHRTLLEELRAADLPADAEPVRPALDAALDAAFAADEALDFSAAESACTGSVLRSLAAVAASPALNPLQVQILVASDVDLLAFATDEQGIGRYDPLTADVLGRLTPVR
jgi:hypothetical protein